MAPCRLNYGLRLLVSKHSNSPINDDDKYQIMKHGGGHGYIQCVCEIGLMQG